MESHLTDRELDAQRTQSVKALAIILFGITFALFGFVSIDLTWKEKDPVKSVLESLPAQQESLNKLALQLVEQDQLALREIAVERGDELWMQEAKSDHPERFIVSPEWFSLLAENKEIPDYQMKKLIEKANGGPLSTTDAALWVYEASEALRSKGAYEEQQAAIRVLTTR